MKKTAEESGWNNWLKVVQLLSGELGSLKSWHANSKGHSLDHATSFELFNKNWQANRNLWIGRKVVKQTETRKKRGGRRKNSIANIKHKTR